jgi:conjugative relaxase-like TrwC/TraI family protein
MAWFRPMGLDSVAYHESTVVGREDDHPGRALAYYASRGETPLRWGGAGAARLGLVGEVTPDAYDAAFGPGGFQDPVSYEVLARTSRPGFELVVGAHKSVAVLGVAGLGEDVHAILDAETSGTLGWLEAWFQERGGRRGDARERTPTTGLTYAVTRHATSRAGDPCPHDHVLVANVVETTGLRAGFMALDSAALRDTTEAATMVGRLHSAWAAAQLGYTIERDDGPSGRLRHWRIAAVPDEACDVFSKRSDEIAEALAESGFDSYRAKNVATRASRSVKRHIGPDQLMDRWHGELAAIGWPLDRLADHLDRAQAPVVDLPFRLSDSDIAEIAAETLDVGGELMRRHKAFTRTQLISELAPRLYGHHPDELLRVLDHIGRSQELVPLLGTQSQREPAYTTTRVLEAEHSIAWAIEQLADRDGRTVDDTIVERAIADKEANLGRSLTTGQRAVIEQLSSSPGAATLVIGVAGAGKTTALDAATNALEAGGYDIIGTSTSGQAARTLGREADISSRTLASLLGRLERHEIVLHRDCVVIVDEAGMANDADLARLTLAVHRAKAHLVLVGDHRQLSAIGPGGALAALMERRPDLVVHLEDNVRQRNLSERKALADLRDGDPGRAIAWYAQQGRIEVRTTRTNTLVIAAQDWASDIVRGNDTALLAWRRQDVADLNRSPAITGAASVASAAPTSR